VRLTSLLKRGTDRSLLLEVNPFQILAAGLTPLDDGTTLLDCTAEFDRTDDEGFRKWLNEHFETDKGWIPTTASFLPPDGLLQRDSLVPRKLIEPNYLPDFIRSQYRINQPADWTLKLVNPLEGTTLAAEGAQRPTLVCGISQADIQRFQRRLVDHRLLPTRVEFGLLPLFGAIAEQKTRQGDKRAVVVVVIEHEQTVAYILGKEGIQTPAPIRHGFASIVHAARREFQLADAHAVRERLHQADEELLLRASKFVRAIGRDLKPICDSYELTTGQPIGELYCAYLPPGLAWIAEPLNLIVGRIPFTFDTAAWLPGVGVEVAEDVIIPGPHWLGALSLIARLPGQAAAKPGRENSTATPWHGNWRIATDLPTNDLVRRRFITNAVATASASGALMFTLWQGYTLYDLRNETEYWRRQIDENRQPFAQATAQIKELNMLTARLDLVYGMMNSPFSVSDLILSLGRTRPAGVQIDTIASTEQGLTLTGSIKDAARQGSRSLRGYVDTLRADPAIGPLFTTITLTTLDRNVDGGTLNFEIAFKHKVSP